MILSPLSFGTISWLADVSIRELLLWLLQPLSNDGAAIADAPPMAIVFRKSLRLVMVYIFNTES